MMKNIDKFIPASGNYLKQGLPFILLNAIILIIGGGIALGLLWIVHLVRLAGFPLPLPVWLIIIGIGVPCFIIWFQYGKKLGCLINERYVIKGLVFALFGDIPALGCLYILLNMFPDFIISREINSIILILLMMLVIMMPIMTILGLLDSQKAGTRK